MLIGHYQCIVHQEQYEKSFDNLIKGLEQAQMLGLEIVSFPESLLNGYYQSKDIALQHAWTIDGPEIQNVLERTKHFKPMYLVGVTERLGDDVYLTQLVVESGKMIGFYRKTFTATNYAAQGCEFPVFQKGGLTFGVLICADGGYIEPARILAIKGAQVIFAPHYNVLDVDSVIQHHHQVRNDHRARAVENGVYFIRGNNVLTEHTVDENGKAQVGYGESYVMNPLGDIVASAGLHEEALMVYNLDLDRQFRSQHRGRAVRSIASAKLLLNQLQETVEAFENDS